MSYRDKLYSTYVSTHASSLYGSTTMDDIKRQIPTWKKYYAKLLPKDKDTEILDIGCGDGGFVYFLRTLGFKNVKGIDLSKEQVELAGNLGIKGVIQADIKEFLSNKSAAYDVVFARDVIEHFAKDEVLEILEMIHRSLRRGGILVAQTINGESFFSGGLRYGDFSHEIVFTRSSLNQIFNVTGFKAIEFHPTGPVPKGLKSFVRYILWKMIEIVLRLRLLIETGSGEGVFTQNIIAAGRKP